MSKIETNYISGTKLPLVPGGRNSLVASSLSQKSNPLTPRETAASWAQDLRSRINENVECHEDVNEDDIMSLKKELIAVFITTLQTDSRAQWSIFVEILALLEHYKEYFDYFETKAEFHHYLERILHHVDVHKSKLFDLQIEAYLTRVFPEHIKQLKSKGFTPSKNYCTVSVPVLTLSQVNTPRSLESPVAAKSHNYPSSLLPDGTNPYAAVIPSDEEILGVKGLTFRDINKSMGTVALEMAARESVWRQSLGTTALALAAELPVEETLESTSTNVSDVDSKIYVTPRKKTPRPVPNMKDIILEMNGREAVQYFACSNHMGKVKSIYLNLAPSRHYSPYNLISVPKSKTNPEHYVFTTFGVIHVYPDQPSDSLTLSEWQREAVLWSALSNIPFFKNYLISKMFQRWRRNCKLIDFQRKQESVKKSLLTATPSFGAAMLQISRLLKELLTVPFLPAEVDKTYQLSEFENNINYKNIQAEKFLNKFFRYCKLIVDFTADEAFKKVKYCEEQLKKKTYFSKDSLSLQRLKREDREKKLANAQQEASYLGNFVKLVDQLIVEHMFEITKTQSLQFFNIVLVGSSESQREGFFKANLIFSKEGELTIFPSKKRFKKALESTFKNIPTVLMSKSIDLDICNPDKESIEGDISSRSDGFKLSEKLSTTPTEIEKQNRAQTSRSASQLSLISASNKTATEDGHSNRSELNSSNKLSKSVDLILPELHQQEFPSKDDDEMGVATPDLVIMHSEDDEIKIRGQGFQGQYEPLSKANLEEKLMTDQEYQQVLKNQEELMHDALVDIDNFCQSNQWLNEIQKFCTLWDEKSVGDFKSAAAFTIEQKLTEIRQWADRVKSFDISYVTENGFFYIDCTGVQEVLLPRLNDIYQEIVSFVADDVNALAHNLIGEMAQILKNMSDKKSDILLFAALAKNFHIYKKNTLIYQQKVEYIKSLYEVIRMSYRQLTPEEEKCEEKVFSSWEAFLMQMQDTSEFVNTQTPLVVAQLEASFQRLQKEATVQYQLATSGNFLDPCQNPVLILSDMKIIREKFHTIQTKLQEVSHCREAITGEPYNLKFLQEMTSKMDIRQELWKYVEVTTHSIRDWNQMLFRKMNFKKALEKISVWQAAAARLTSHLPQGDKVLEAWVKQIEDFHKHLPVLIQLSHDSLQERHWQAIFMGMNVPYDPNSQLTVAELISYNLADHADLINSIYLSALTENNVGSRLSNIITFWQEREFKLAKYIPDSLYNKEQPKRSTSSNARIRKLERYRQERAAAQTGQLKGLDISSDDFYVLIEVEELKYHLEDSRITLEAMLVSPHVSDTKNEVDFWCEALKEIEEITDLWFDCQKKWQYLLKIFEHPIMYQKFSEHAFKFEFVHNKFKDWMRVSSSDSKCLSVVSRRRGEKGYRLLQGENLRILLQSLIKEQEEILKDLESYIEKSRTVFHRLYFLSNEEIFEMLAVSRNLPALLPFVQRCFPNIKNMTFSLPAALGTINSQLDFALNSDKLEVVNISGSLGEELPLYTKVEPVPSAPKWLQNINQILKNTLTIALKACVQARLEEGTKQPILVLEELARLSKDNASPAQEEITHEIKSIFGQWLLRFPAQSVLTAEAIMWERSMSKTLDKKDKEELKNQKFMLCAKVDQLIQVLLETQTFSGFSETEHQRLSLIICSLLTQSIYCRDIMGNLIETNQVTDSAFDWLKILKLRMDIRNVLRAKTIITEKLPEEFMKNRTTRRNPLSKRKMPDAPKLTRTQTTVTNDYQFGMCYAQQLNQVFSYDYEYLGPSNQLVITPLTERAFLSMGQALKSFHCSCLIGPSGTGKTETITELGKLLGRCMFAISCHDTITLPVMLRYLTGMIQSGCWAIFDETDRLTKGLMSVIGQQLDYLRTALRALAITSENQYQIRGHSQFDKKSGIGDKVIRRNSLTTLHPLPKRESDIATILERQKTVPHGFNEKGLVTYFEDTWVAERDQRRHSIEREIRIKESDLYKSHKPPPLFYEHVKASRRRSQPDYSKLTSEPSYSQKTLGNVMFNGKLLQASSNFGCFMTMNAFSATSVEIPYSFRLLMRPCAMVVPDLEIILSVHLESFGYKKHGVLAKKLVLLFKQLESQIWKPRRHLKSLNHMKQIIKLAVAKRLDVINSDSGLKREENNHIDLEESSIVFAVKELLIPCTESESDKSTFISILRQVFPLFSVQQDNNLQMDQRLSSAVLEIFKEDNMESNEIMQGKILELYKSLESSSAVILAGQPGSGKTKLYHTLARAVNLLNYKLFSSDTAKEDIRAQSQASVHHSLNKQSTSYIKEEQDMVKFPKVDVVHLFPGAMTPDQFLGRFENGIWQDGLLSKILKDSYIKWLANMNFIQAFKSQEKKSNKYSFPLILKRWIVMDGYLDTHWTEGIKTLLDSQKQFSQGSGEVIKLEDLTKIIFETTDLKAASPSTVSNSTVIYLGNGTTSWSALYYSWKQTAGSKWFLSAEGLKMLDEIVSVVFPATIKFLSQSCQTALLTDIGNVCTAANNVTPGVSEVSAFLNIFSALLDRALKREEKENVFNNESSSQTDRKTASGSTRLNSSRCTNTSQIEAVVPNYQEHLKHVFVFAYIWGFGGHLHDKYKDNFSDFAHNILYRTPHPIQLPTSGLVFDYYIDEKTSEFANWNCRQQQDRIKNLAGFYVIPEVDRYAYLIELLMAANQPVLLSGAPGVGKTSFVQSMVLSKIPSTQVNMSNGLTSTIFQDLILAHISALKSISNSRLGATAGSVHEQSKHLFFIDDLNMAPMTGGYQPPLELMRSLLTTGGMYDRKRKEFLKTKEASFIAATTIPTYPGTGLGKSCHIISSRLTRHFVNLTFFTPPEDSLVTLFSKPLQTWLEEFPTCSVEHCFEFSRAMSSALVELFERVRVKLTPCPLQAHYIFTLHDLSKVVQGILLLSPRTHVKKGKALKKGASKKNEYVKSAPMMKVIAQLWCHEVCRNFGDRIIHSEDNIWFSQQLENIVAKYFCSPNEKYKQHMTVMEENYQETTMSNSVENVNQQKRAKQEDSLPRKEKNNEMNWLAVSSNQIAAKRNKAESPIKSHASSTISQKFKLDNTTFEHESADSNLKIQEREDNDVKVHDKDEDIDLTDDSDSYTSSELSSSDDIEESHSKTIQSSSAKHQHYSEHNHDFKMKKSPDQNNFNNGNEETTYKRQDSNKRVVTFKAGLLADKKPVFYSGPLLSFNEIKGAMPDLTSFIFSKFYMGCHAETLGIQTEKGYAQQTEEKLTEALYSCLNKYNKGTSQRIDLVFFCEAVQHAARLSRVLAQPKGHALLLGMSYCTGRATITRLAAYIAHCKLFEAKAQSYSSDNLAILRKYIKLSCYHAGVTGKPTVLLVHEDLGEEGLYDIAAIMTEGTAPDLYTEMEKQNIVGQLLPGGVQTKKLEKIEQVFNKYIKRIRQNLHIIVCINYKGNSFSTNVSGLNDKLQKHPGLIKNCVSIDIYMPWSFKSLAQVAKTWLQDGKSGVVVPWNPSCSEEQLEATANAMAFIHLSSKAAIERQFCHQREPLRIFTPLTFLEFVHLFKIIAAFLAKTEKVKGKKYDQALNKINEAFGSIADYRKEVSGLMPQHLSAARQVTDLVAQVEDYKQSYIKALEQCKVQEETIYQLQTPLESLRQTAQTEFDKVNPVYQAAVKVLDNLDINSVEELRSYPSPPDGVKFVMKAVCLLFNKPQNWESAKALMVNPDFFQELIFYKKDDIPDFIFQELKKFVYDASFVPEIIVQASSAAASICSWIHAVYAYSIIQRKMKPRMKDLMEAENKLTKAQAQLGQYRVEAQQIKTNLEQYISQHKEAIKISKAIEKQIQAVERKIACANNLMENMSMQHFLWRSELKKTRRHIKCAPGDALLTSACVAYHGPLDDKSRLDLMQNWMDLIRQNTLNAQAYENSDPYSITAKLEFLKDAISGRRDSEDQSELGQEYELNLSVSKSSYPQVKTFKYMSAVYDSSKYYKSELKRQGTMESVVPEQEFIQDDDDDDEEQIILPTRPNLTLQEILSDFDELSEWRMLNLPTDLHSVQNALMMRVCCHNRKHCWPLLVDPDNQAEMWVKALHKSHNIFTQKDVADFEIEDEIPIDDIKNDEEEKDIYQTPPSRGTMLTYNITESSQYSYSPRGGQSEHTVDSEELLPVTSVTNSWDNYSLHADSEIDVNSSNLWVLEADDIDVNSRLINAIVHGVTVLITHLERKPLDPLFRGLLLKQFYVDKEGNKVVKVGDMIFNYHPNFCLYLSTSVPLFVKGDGLHNFPLNRVSVINMAVSDEAIINRLMFETMQVEKKEFEGQRRSNENDIILHRQRLAREHEIIREKTLNLTGPLLEDKTMLDSLLACQTNVEHNRQILQETRFMGDHLEEKFAHYTPFVKHSAMLYNVLSKMSVLYPCYYLPFYKFVEIFAAIVRSRDRGKGSLGAPQVRAQELSNAVLHGVFKYAKLMMFEQHYNLLALIVSLERMLRQHKASNKELSLFVNGFQKLGLNDVTLAEQKPEWMDNNTWIDCSILESLHHPFQGLCQSLVNNSHQWKEYFQHQVSLVNSVPGNSLQELSLFQKCLLWKFVGPKKFAELANAIILYELGSTIDTAINYDIREVYTYTDKHTPTVFILPSAEKAQKLNGTVGPIFINPVQEIKRLAREMNMEGKVCVLSFGVGSQMSDVNQAIEDCMQAGHWLLLQNYHLADEPATSFFDLLKFIIYSRWNEDSSSQEQAEDTGRCLVTRSCRSSQVSPATKINTSFRMWITTKADGSRIMPGLLIQHGLRVTCELTSNFRSLLGKAYKSTAFLISSKASSDEQLEQRFSRVMPLALIHAIIVQQSYYGCYGFANDQFWTMADIVSAVDIFQNLSVWTKDKEAVSNLIAHVYSDHCLDLLDAHVIESVAKILLANKHPSNPTKGVVSLLNKLSAAFKETSDLQKTLDSIDDRSAYAYYLTEEREELHIAKMSKIFLKELVQATGAPELLLSEPHTGGILQNIAAADVLATIHSHLAALPEMFDISVDQIMPTDAFFAQELRAYKVLVNIIKSDMQTVNEALAGKITVTPDMLDILDAISIGEVPSAWLNSTFITCKSLDSWLKLLPVKIKYVQNCFNQTPMVLSMNMLMRPDQVFHTVKLSYACKHFKDLTNINLEFQVMPNDFEPEVKPVEGLYITGLQLKNAHWDNTTASLTETLQCTEVMDFPIIWVKPNVLVSDLTKQCVYMCPLYSSNDPKHQNDSSLLYLIPLSTVSPVVCAQRRVSLTVAQQ